MPIRVLSLLHIVVLTIFGLCGVSQASSRLDEDKSKAVILAYFAIDDDSQPDSSLSMEQFRAHIHEMLSAQYNVLPLPEVIGRISKGGELPPKTIALTFEGASPSVLEKAAPLLLESKLPFTVFYDTENTDFHVLEKLKLLKKNALVSLGILPSSAHLAYASEKDILSTLNKSRHKHRETFDEEADFLSYPYGEYSSNLKEKVQLQGFKASLTLRSGVLYPGEDFYAIPRFTMTDRYGNLERFRMIANALPLPLKDLDPSDPYLRSTDWYAGFTVPESLASDLSSLDCFLSGLPKPKLEKLGQRVEVRSSESIPTYERIRLNCTMNGPPTDDDTPQWRWFGMLYHQIDNQEAAQNLNLAPDELPSPQE